MVTIQLENIVAVTNRTLEFVFEELATAGSKSKRNALETKYGYERHKVSNTLYY